MANQTIIHGDLLVRGNISVATSPDNTAGSITQPSGSITNAKVAADAAIAATKVQHQHTLGYSQAAGTAVVAETKGLFVARNAGVIVSVEAAIIGTIATGADRTVDVNVLKSTAGGAFATVLTANIQFTNVSVLRTVSVAALAATTFVDGDIFEVVVTVAGAAGNQALGLVVSVNLQEVGA